MSFKPLVKVDNKFSSNAQRFETQEEAQRAADDLMSRWFAVMDTSTEETTDPVNYQIKDNQISMINRQLPFTAGYLQPVEYW